MNSLFKVAGIASLLMFGTGALMAQSQTDAPKAPSSSGAVKDEKPTDPNAPKDQSAVKKMEKEKEKTQR